jgi:hypothetical protein
MTIAVSFAIGFVGVSVGIAIMGWLLTRRL